MIYFKLSRAYFHLMGVILSDSDRQYFMKTCLKNVIIVFLLAVYVWYSGGFIYIHRNRFEKATTAIAMLLGCICACSQFVFCKVNETKLAKLMMNFQHTIDQGMFNERFRAKRGYLSNDL